MAIVVTFEPTKGTVEQYDEVIERLRSAGEYAPAGRSSHIVAATDGGFRVTDVWESSEEFERFGRVLMPILAEVGIELPPPAIAPLHRTIDDTARVAPVELFDQLLGCFRRADMAGFAALLHRDAVWHVPGKGPIAGDHKGTDEILGLLGRMAELTEGTLAVSDPSTLTATDSQLIVRYRLTGRRGGKELNADEVSLFSVEDGLLGERFVFFRDQHAFDAFWE